MACHKLKGILRLANVFSVNLSRISIVPGTVYAMVDGRRALWNRINIIFSR